MDPIKELEKHFVDTYKTYQELEPDLVKEEFDLKCFGKDVKTAFECLKYNHDLLCGLQRLQTKVSLSDVSIKIGGKVFYAHRCVLAAASSYFESMFTSGFEESHKTVIEIKDVDDYTFGLLLNFAYSGTINLSLDTAVDVLRAAMYLQFPHVQNACESFLIEALKEKTILPEDALSLLVIAEDQGMTELSEHSCKWLLKTANFLHVMLTDTFQEKAPFKLIDSFLRRIDITPTTNEEELFRQIYSWIKQDWENRKKYAAIFLRRFRLGLIALDKVKEVIDVQVIHEVPECKEILDSLEQNWEKYASEDDVAGLPETFLPRNFVRTLVCLGGEDVHPGHFGRFYNKMEKNWNGLSRLPTLPVPYVMYPSAAVVKRDIYLAGGDSMDINQPCQNSLFKFDGERCEWVELPRMRDGRYFFTLVHFDGYLYAIAGKGDGSYLDSVERFSLTDGKWDCVYTLPEAMICASTAILDGVMYVYAVKSITDNADYNIDAVHVLVAFDPATQHWTKLLEERYELTDACPNSVIVVQENVCYRVWYEEVESDFAFIFPPIFKVHVNLVEIRKLRNGGFRAWIGDEMSDNYDIPQNRANVFHINGQAYINCTDGCVHKTGLVLDRRKLDLEGWENCSKSSTATVVEYTVDLKRLLLFPYLGK